MSSSATIRPYHKPCKHVRIHERDLEEVIASGRTRFDDWADQWWKVWSQDKSPSTLQAAESHLRLHVRPTFDARRLNSISPATVRGEVTQGRGARGRPSL